MIPPDAKFAKPLDVEYLRELLNHAELTQRGAAKVLGIHERQMRYYCSGDIPIPYTVQYALEMLVTCKLVNKATP